MVRVTLENTAFEVSIPCDIEFVCISVALRTDEDFVVIESVENRVVAVELVVDSNSGFSLVVLF